jgi:hypothetical protein
LLVWGFIYCCVLWGLVELFFDYWRLWWFCGGVIRSGF